MARLDSGGTDRGRLKFDPQSRTMRRFWTAGADVYFIYWSSIHFFAAAAPVEV
jgi:hypothetical protein